MTIKMDNLIQIRLSKTEFNKPEIKATVFKFYSDVVTKAIDWEVWDESIKAIIITDEFNDELEKQADLWGITLKLSKEKEFKTASKILFNHNLDAPERYIFFPFINLFLKDLDHERVALNQIISIHSRNILPLELVKQMLSEEPSTLEEYVKFASTEWCVAVNTRQILSQIYSEPDTLINHNSLLTAFKRKLKKSLYAYNSDASDSTSRLVDFWYNYIDILSTLILRITECQDADEALLIKESELSRDLVYNIIHEVNELTKQCQNANDYDVTNLKEVIKAFSAHFDVHLENESDENFHIRLTKNPKDYFIDEIVETEPRIICFMDILGFSELINEYENDITSTVLQDIQESFAIAKENLLENNIHHDTDGVKHIKYQTFSDNICISIPYFDNANDFLYNLNLLITYVRGFQSIMMSKGFFTRGGVSIGSYYADNNIIFSLGLVKAYHLESKKAIYPRIILDNDIVEKLLKYESKQVRNYGLDKVIIFDWENSAFLNPFNLLHATTSHLESLFNDTNIKEDGSLSNVLNTLLDYTKRESLKALKLASEHEKQLVENIKKIIIEKLSTYKNNIGVVTKYTWLLEFIKWLENDEAAKLRFGFLNDRLV